MKTKIYVYLLILFAISISACKEESRYETEGDDTTPPSVPTNITWEPLYGGARFHYTLPSDEDLMTVNAEYTNEKGNTYFFSSSFYKDSVDVYGLGSTNEYTVYLYGVDRAGNKSQKVPVKVVPFEPAISRVAKTIDLKAGFGSFFLDWENELEQVINVYINFKYKDGDMPRDMISVFSSNKLKERQFVYDVNVAANEPLNVKVRVEDRYGNMTEFIDFGDIFLQEDAEIDKSIWVFPEANDSTVILRNGTRFNAGIPAMFGNNLEGRMDKLKDNVIDRGDYMLNFFHTGGRGRTGRQADGNMWNIILDMGAYYKLSRIVTHQRHSGGADGMSRGQYYRDENCGEFRLYYFDEETMQWELCSQQRTPIPTGVSDLQIVLKGYAGDMTYFYPDDPQYTKPTRWFRYEYVRGFQDNYTSTYVNCMSELRLYGVRVP